MGILLGIFGDIYLRSIEPVHAETIEEIQSVEILVEVVYTEKSVEQKIKDAFPHDAVTAVAVGKAESGQSLYARAYNPEWHYDKHGNKLCQGSYGVMQVACVHHMQNPEALFDVDFNLQKAKQIYAERGWKPWGGYTSGGYKKYMQ